MGKKHGPAAPRSGLVMAAAAAGASLAAVAVMALLTLPSADDFWYRLFLNNGLRSYLALLKEHYLTFNGRVIVHIAAQVTLHFGNWCFAVVSAALFVLIPCALTAASGRDRESALWACALFLPAVLSLPRSLLNQGILWISAFFNYVLPTAMLTADILVYELCAGRKRAGLPLGALCVVLSAACGATTEQSGAAAVALSVYFLARALLTKRGRVTSALALLGSAGGLFSIFASPATRLRVNAGASVGSFKEIISTMYANMAPCAGELCASWLTPAALAALFLLAGGAAARRLGKKWPLALSCLPAAASLAAMVLPEGARTALFTALCFAAGAAAAALMASGQEPPGLMVLAGLATFAAILVTDSSGGRTLVPFLLMLLAADAVLLSAYIRSARGVLSGLGPAALLALGLAAVIPFVGGMLKNRRVDLENRENVRAAHETGVLRYCIDYDMEYTWLKIQSDFSAQFLAYEGLPEDLEIQYYSHLRPGVIANGQELYPSYLGEDGEVYFWIGVVNSFGGSVSPRGDYDHLTVTLPWAQCDVDPVPGDPGAAVFTWTEDGETRSVTLSRLRTEFRTWYPLEVYTDILGFVLLFNQDRNTYTFLPPAPEE